MNKNIVIGALAVVAVVFVVLYLGTLGVVQYGAQSGPTHTNPEQFLDNTRILTPIITGASSTIATTTEGTSYITASHVCDTPKASLLVTNPAIATTSILYLPTAQAVYAKCLTTIGDSVSFTVRNVSASTTIVTAQSASTTIVYPNVTGATTTLLTTEYARVTLFRAANNLMTAFLQIFKVQ